MGFTVNLVTGLGELLDAAGVGSWGGPWAAADTALVVDALPASPDKAVALTLYDVQDDATTDSIVGLQCRVRGSAGSRTDAKDILDVLFDTLHDLKNTTLGGAPIVRIWKQSGTNLGPDSANRPEHTANYYIQLTRTGSHRED